MPWQRYEVAYRKGSSPFARFVRWVVALTVVLAVGVAIGAATNGGTALGPSGPGTILGSLLRGQGWPTAPAQPGGQATADAIPSPQWTPEQCTWALRLLEHQTPDNLVDVAILLRKTTCVHDPSPWPQVTIDGGPPSGAWTKTPGGPAMTASGCQWATYWIGSAERVHEAQPDTWSLGWVSAYKTLIGYFGSCADMAAG